MDLEQFRPMLSASLPCMKGLGRTPTQEEVIRDLQRLDWSDGFLASPKFDGIRAIKHPQFGLVSRTLKPIPNAHIQRSLVDIRWNYLDGELIAGNLDRLLTFNENQSAIMSEGGEPEFTFCVFDYIETHDDAFVSRAEEAEMRCYHGGSPLVRYVPQTVCKDVDELLAFEEDCVGKGFEGIILRHPYGAYKNNRSTFRQQGMIKIKRFVDAEARIVGFKELYRNTNEPRIDLLGYTKRSAHNAGQVAAGTLGKFEVVGINGEFTDVEFECGSGLNDSLRDVIWRDRDAYLGKLIKYKYQPTGSKNKPRSPIFLGFRSVEDL